MTAPGISSSYDFSIIIQRWAATWLDLLFFAGSLAVLFGIASKLFPAAFVVWLILFLLYYPILEGLWGITIGKLICGLVVVDENGKRPGIGKAILRTLVRLVEVNPALFGGIPAGIVAATSKSRQRLGDMMARTYVLRMSDMKRLTSGQLNYTPAGDFDIGIPETTPPASTAPIQSPPLIEPTRYRIPLRTMTICAVLITLIGADGIIQGWSGLKNPKEQMQPITMDCAQFLKSPKDGWYHLTGCQYDLSEAAYQTLQLKSESEFLNEGSSSDSKHVTEVYVPVYGSNYTEGQRTPLLLQSSDSKLMKLATELIHMDKSDKKSINKWAEAHAEDIAVERDITGIVVKDPYIDGVVEKEVGHIQREHLTTPFKMMNEGDYPMPISTYCAIGGGIVFGFIALGLWVAVVFRALDKKRQSGNQPPVSPWQHRLN